MFNQCKHSWNLKHLGELGWCVGSPEKGGGVSRDLTFLSHVYLKQELSNLLLTAPSKATWSLLTSVPKYKDISHFEKSQALII